MTHDPLCPDSDPNRWVSKDFNGNSMSCRCEEYAKVREDERAIVVSEFMSNHGDIATFELGYSAALDASIAAVCEAIGEEWQGKIVPKCEYDCCGCNSYNGIVDDAVTAIKALGGER